MEVDTQRSSAAGAIPEADANTEVGRVAAAPEPSGHAPSPRHRRPGSGGSIAPDEQHLPDRHERVLGEGMAYRRACHCDDFRRVSATRMPLRSLHMQ